MRSPVASCQYLLELLQIGRVVCWTSDRSAFSNGTGDFSLASVASSRFRAWLRQKPQLCVGWTIRKVWGKVQGELEEDLMGGLRYPRNSRTG